MSVYSYYSPSRNIFAGEMVGADRCLFIRQTDGRATGVLRAKGPLLQ